MSGSFWIDVPRRCVFSRGWGLLTDEDLLGHIEQLRQHPDFDASFDQCVDYRGVEKVGLTRSAVRVAAETNPFLPAARRAFVVNRVVMLGLTRMYQLSADVPETAMDRFETLEAALEWLGLDPAAGWPKAEPHWVRDTRESPAPASSAGAQAGQGE